MNNTEPSARFLRIGFITLLALYFLIFIGGTVRASGSGMGCPDWPTCFGRLIPPTDESQLPPDYHKKYVGYGNTTFNPVKTWTEYVNRLVGVSIGIGVLMTFLYSIPYLRKDRVVFWSAFSVFLLVGFQGWLGSRVVASELRPMIITAHMVTAFFIVMLLIYTLIRSQKDTLYRIDLSSLPPVWRTFLLVAMGMLLLQITMGTQIRETIDTITNEQLLTERSLWREHFPIIFYIHRSFSSVILFTHIGLAWIFMRRVPWAGWLRRAVYALPILTVLAISTGVALDRLGFPAAVQPVHLLLANLIFGCQFFLFLRSAPSLVRA